MTRLRHGSPARGSSLAGSLGLHRVADPAERLAGVLPQAAWRLDPNPRLAPDEVRIRVDRLNLDAASYRQLHDANGGDGDTIREAVAEIIASRGKMHNPVTGSGGMLTGVVAEAGPDSPLNLKPGDRVATLVSLTLTPLEIYDKLAGWDGLSEQVPCDGHAILFGRSIAAVLPDDLPVPLALAVLDVCGAPALTRRVIRKFLADNSKKRAAPQTGGIVVAVIGAAGKSGSLSAAAAREAGASHIIGVVPTDAEASLLRAAGLVDEIVMADARQSLLLAEAVTQAGGPVDVTVVCVDVPGCEGGAILATQQGGTVIFFSMATSFSAAALGAEGVAADVTMLVGSGYVPGHADYALRLIRTNPAVRHLFDARLGGEGAWGEVPGGLPAAILPHPRPTSQVRGTSE
jgi:L-erythro-3,5-diaminohexanoate dehydrogenase